MRNKRSLFTLSVGILLVVFGLVLAMCGSIYYRDISFLPLSLGVTVLLISLFTEVGRKISRDSRGRVSYGILVILIAFALSFIIIGVIIPLMQG